MAEDVDTAKPRAIDYTRIIGIVATLVCCAFVWQLLKESFPSLVDQVIAGPALVAMVGCVALWVVSNICLGLGWQQIMAALGEKVSKSRSVSIALKSQIGKYLPGNVFHLAGRVALARSSGCTATRASIAVATEALLLVAIAGLISVRIAMGTPYFVWAFVGGLMAVVVGVWMLRSRIGFYFENREHSILGIGARSGAAIASYVTVFIIQTLGFLWVAFAIDPSFSLGLWNTLEMISASWAAGFIVVGSPGGLGVREYVFSLFASGVEESGFIVLVATVMRICSILGDVFSLLFGLAIDRYRKE